MLQNILTVSLLLTIALEHDILIEEDSLDLGLPWWLSGQKSACQFRRHSLISGLGRSPEKEMATHSGLLTWETAWTEEPGGPQSRGLQSQTDSACTHIALALSVLSHLQPLVFSPPPCLFL